MFHSLISSKKRKAATISAIALLSFSAFVAIFGGATVPTVLQRSGFNVGTGTHVDLTYTIYHHDQKFANLGWLAGQWAKGVYFMPSCLVFCNGITYSVDPSSLAITNGGHNFEQCKVFGSAGTGDGSTCTAADIAQYMSVSTSTTLTATSTSCTGQYTSNGFDVSAATITAGAAGSTVTTTLTHTWTATGATSALATACIQTENTGGGNIILYSIAPFGPDTLANGDTLKITWTIART